MTFTVTELEHCEHIIRYKCLIFISEDVLMRTKTTRLGEREGADM